MGFNSNIFTSVARIGVLLALIVACTVAVIYSGLASALVASLVAAGAFFATVLCIQQVQMAQAFAKLRSQTDGMAEFEQDILRRVEAPSQGSGRTPEVTHVPAAETNRELLEKITMLQERIQAVEKNSGTGFQNVVSPAPLQRKSSKSTETTSTGVLAKPITLSKINLKNALASGGLTMHLQPIVDLPDRQPVHYEAFMRLQMKNGDFLDANQFIKVAKKGGLMPMIDKKVLFSSVRMLRTLEVLKKKAGLFCNISAETLGDARTFREIANFLQANIALKSSLVFEISQAAYRHLNKREKERLLKLADMGFQLSLDQVIDMKIDLGSLSQKGFHYVKIPAGMLLKTNLDDDAPLVPTELSASFGDHNIKLIATEVERETEVMNLIDFGIDNAQGNVFAPPRAVKAELLKGPTKSSSRSTRITAISKKTNQKTIA